MSHVDGLRVHNNQHGFRGVEWRSDRGKFRARIWPTPGVRGYYLGTFDTAEQAALAYDAEARRIYGDAAYLNFPRDGERQAIASTISELICARGHDLTATGYVRPDGRGITCRQCNNEASKRAYHRKAALTPPNTRTI